MRRLVVPVVVVLAVPALAWTVAGAEPSDGPPACDGASTTSETSTTTTLPAGPGEATTVVETTTTTPAETTTTTTPTTTTTTTTSVAGLMAPDPCITTTTTTPDTAGVVAPPSAAPPSASTAAPTPSTFPTAPTPPTPPAPSTVGATAEPADRSVPAPTSPGPTRTDRPAQELADGPAEAAVDPAIDPADPAIDPAEPAVDPAIDAVQPAPVVDAAPAEPPPAPVPETVVPTATVPAPAETPAPDQSQVPAEPAVAPVPVEPGPTMVPEDVESAPVVAPPRSAGGRSLVPSGVVDVGAVRPIVFPVVGPVRYSNDFGACRAGCRRQHQGVDLIGDRLQPLVAMREGIVDRLLDHPTAGFGVVIRDAEGWEYHQYHLNNDTPATDDGLDDGSWRFAGGVVVGGRVTAGQLIGWMGDSGNSEGSVPHTHVEIHTPAGQIVNPYWSLRAAQRDANCGLTALPAPVPVFQASLAGLTDERFLEDGWSSPAMVADLPGIWMALPLTGGRPGSTDVKARMWIGPDGFTPVDVAAVGLGDRRYDDDDCEPPAPGSTSAPPAAGDPSPTGTPAADQAAAAAPIPADLGAILATIRAMETGGDYRTQISSSTASGAYAFLDSSWDAYGGYRRARDAPPPVQDAKAAWLARHILDDNDGDVTTIPVSWYIGHVPQGAEWDTVPPVGANVLTPRQYQARWMAMYAKVLGTPEMWVTGAGSWTPAGQVCRTTLIDLAGPGRARAYGLTQAGTFVDDGTGRAVPAANDPCDPNRPVPAPPPTPPPPDNAALRGPSG